MKVSRVLLLALFGLSFSFAFAAQTQTSEPCARQTSIKSSLHIAWIDCNNNDDEVLIIVNGIYNVRELDNYKITNHDDSKVFTFKKDAFNISCCVIGAHEVLRIHSGSDNNVSAKPYGDLRDLHWLVKSGDKPIGEPIWVDTGDTATLLDRDGNVIDTYEYPNESK